MATEVRAQRNAPALNQFRYKPDITISDEVNANHNY